MEASVIISYYKNLPNLEAILFALNDQSASGKFEVIVSEDDDAIETKTFIDKVKASLRFPIVHLTQEDAGFRKCRALNRAVKATLADFMIFLDGDCIPHRHLVKEYIQAKAVGRVLYGRRAMLSEKITKKILSKKKISHLNFFKLAMAGCKRIEEALYLRFIPQSIKEKTSGILLGCNMACSKTDLISINGFDEDYVAPGGGEDSDLEWRWKAHGGITFFSMKFRAIVYHLYHQERFSKEMEMKNYEILNNKIKQGFFFCKNGLEKIS